MENLNITDHALSKIANSWAELLPSEDIGIRTAFAHGFKVAIGFKSLGIENIESANNKSAFFAQYWGQEVLSDITNRGTRILYPINVSNFYNIDECFLELKPLSLITNEHAIEAANFLNVSYSNNWRDGAHFDLYGFREWINEVFDGIEYLSLVGYNVIRVIDYLRSKSYALPYNGISVEKQIQLGWVKLKKEEVQADII